MDRPYQAVVSNGIALLDEKKPGWRNKVDLTKLDMHSCLDCILGQVFGNYFLTVCSLFSSYLDPTEVDYGFNLLSKFMEPRNYAELTQEWFLQLSQEPK